MSEAQKYLYKWKCFLILHIRHLTTNCRNKPWPNAIINILTEFFCHQSHSIRLTSGHNRAFNIIKWNRIYVNVLCVCMSWHAYVYRHVANSVVFVDYFLCAKANTHSPWWGSLPCRCWHFIILTLPTAFGQSYPTTPKPSHFHLSLPFSSLNGSPTNLLLINELPPVW